MTGPDEMSAGAVQEELRARAARYAEPPPTEVSSLGLGVFVGCRVGGQSIGLPIRMVEEFAALSVFTPLPGLNGVLGATQLRGEFLGVLDIGSLLVSNPSPSGKFILVLKASAGRTAAIVDGILGKRKLSESDLLPEDQFPLPGPAFFGMSKELWALCDASKLTRILDQAGSLHRLTT